jgi:hypothetical protein
MTASIEMIKDLKPFMKIFINEPSLRHAKDAAQVHALAAGAHEPFDPACRKEFDKLINYMWMAATKERKAHQAATTKQVKNPIAFKKWLWDTRPDSKYDPQELAMGTEIEMKEHGLPKVIAKKLAKDHLDDIPNYYTILIKMKIEIEPFLNKMANPIVRSFRQFPRGDSLTSSVTGRSKNVIKKNPELAKFPIYLPVVKEKPKEEPKERVINYAEFNDPRLYKQRPVQQTMANPSKKHKNPTPPTAPASPKNKPVILIVEDNGIQAEINSLNAQKYGFEPIIAYNGLEGITHLPEANVVCTDGDFPYNEEFYAALKKSGKPFIIVSGNDSFKGRGELAFVMKPAKSDDALKLLMTHAHQKTNPTAKIKKASNKDHLIIQSVSFEKSYGIANAKKTLKHYGLKSSDVDKKPNTIRFRQHPPSHFTGFFSHKFLNSMVFTIGKLKKAYKGKYKTYNRKHPTKIGDFVIPAAKKK